MKAAYLLQRRFLGLQLKSSFNSAEYPECMMIMQMLRVQLLMSKGLAILTCMRWKLTYLVVRLVVVDDQHQVL